MTKRKLLSIGECMIEISGSDPNAMRLGYAGDTFNTAWYLRQRLAPEAWAVSYFTALGDDIYSARLQVFMEEHGIDTGDIVTIPGKRPGLYIIHQAEGDRHFTYWRETSAARRLADDMDRLRAAAKSSELIYFSGITLAILAHDRREAFVALMAEMKAEGKITAFDPNIRPALWPDSAEMRTWTVRAAAAARIVLPTFDDETRHFGDVDKSASADRYLGYGAEEVVVKDGAKPALVATAGHRVEVEGVKGAVVRDATGAGDSFNGAYLAARLEGKSPEEAARAGHETAARVIGFSGALVSAEDLARA